jgi:hypothetical protein
MRLVNDDEIEVSDAKAALAVARLIDQPHHGRIGRDENSTLGVLFSDQVHRGCVGQMPLECIYSLIHERNAVC